MATAAARARGMPILGLSTGSPGFYEPLGWARRSGPARLVKDDGTSRADSSLMILETVLTGAPILRNAGESLTTVPI
jgi:hypothetical protein